LETAVTSPNDLLRFFKLTAVIPLSELLVKITPSQLQDFIVIRSPNLSDFVVGISLLVARSLDEKNWGRDVTVL
jgi:hypothetical protein